MRQDIMLFSYSHTCKYKRIIRTASLSCPTLRPSVHTFVIFSYLSDLNQIWRDCSFWPEVLTVLITPKHQSPPWLQVSLIPSIHCSAFFPLPSIYFLPTKSFFLHSRPHDAQQSLNANSHLFFNTLNTEKYEMIFYWQPRNFATYFFDISTPFQFPTVLQNSTIN